MDPGLTYTVYVNIVQKKENNIVQSVVRRRGLDTTVLLFQEPTSAQAHPRRADGVGIRVVCVLCM